MLIANLLGIFSFLFTIWKRLKDDYHPEKIFSLGFLILGICLPASLISKFLFPFYWFWIVFASCVVGLFIGVRLYKTRFFESFEAVFLGLLIWLDILFLTDTTSSSSLLSFIAFWVCLMAIFLFFFLDTRYKSFVWYKSGKVGFSGLFVFCILFLIRSVVAFINVPVISFIGRLDGFISLSVGFLGLFSLYKLSCLK